MKTKLEQFPANNPNPVLSVEKDGTVVFLNKAGEPLLYEWGVRVGEKLPPDLVDFVQKVTSQNSPEKMEIKVSKRIYLLVFHPLPEQECVNISGFDISDQKELEERLLESEKRCSEAQRLTHIGSWDWNIVANKMYRSDEMYRVLGLNSHFDTSYGVFLKYLHPEDRVNLDNALIDTLNGKPFDNNYRIVLSDGEERTVHIIGEVIFDENNNPIRVRGIVQDITELKKSEEKIQKLAAIVESSSDAIETISLDGIITSWNKSAEQVYGYSAEEILRKPVSTLAPPHLDKETINLIKMIKQGDKIRHYETLRLRKDGKPINVSITFSPVYDASGKLNAVSFISRDITENKKAEEKLRESEEKYRNIVETANEGILITDDEAIITYANKRMVDMLGYNFEESIGRPIWGFISEEYKPIVKTNLEKRRQGISESYELKLIRKDGSHLWAYTNAKSLFDRDGKYMGALSMITDIDRLKEAEEALRNIEIVRKKEIHHRIKNNLQVISSFLDLQADLFKGRKNITDSEVLEAFKVSMDRVISIALIHEELYKGENIEVLNFSLYIKELANNLLLTYRLETDVSLNFDLEENLLFDIDTAIPLGIIINELVSNSFKYAFSGRDKGEIRVKLHREENGERKREEFASTAYVLSVSDNGTGIPEDVDIENLDSLGLQLITTLVDQLDGELELNRDNGTEFIIRFTVTEKDDQASTPAPN